MISFLICLAALIAGYLVYGRITERVFAPDDRQTPAIAINDGVDCVPLPLWKSFLIQLLNIAGTGPIFGALMGAVFGPVVFLWIVLGSVLGGAVHDYMTGMISSRNGGRSIAELSGKYLGKAAKYLMRVFSVVLLVLCGTVFITSPAKLLDMLTPDVLSTDFWIICIIIYYLLATLLPIDKLIGKLYPVFGIILIAMAVGISGKLLLDPQWAIPEISLANLHDENLPIWPYMFVTVACGAVSGFHATQSPMISKCIIKERHGRPVFYGAMITEAAIALVWAAAGVTFYNDTHGLSAALTDLGQSGVVYDISTGLLGTVGGILAVVGVIVCPITSGDTAFRSARLILAESFGLEQKKFKNRLLLTVPLLLCGALLSKIDFDVLWRYFSWSNQALATVTLWTATSYLLHHRRSRTASLLTGTGATFMSAVCATYILAAEEGFRLSMALSVPIGVSFAAVLFALYFYVAFIRKKHEITED